jgi:cyanophycin synthetase
VLLNRAVQAAVIENGSRTILSEGLAYDRCQVGVVINLDPADVLPEFYVHDAEQLANVFRTQVDVILPDGVAVLNADDPRVASMARLCDGTVIFFAVDGTAPIVAEHRAQGGRAVFVRNGRIILARGREETLLTEVASIPFAKGGKLAWQTQNILAAVGAAWALGIGSDLMRAGIETFGVDAIDLMSENLSPALETSS